MLWSRRYTDPEARERLERNRDSDFVVDDGFYDETNEDYYSDERNYDVDNRETDNEEEDFDEDEEDEKEKYQNMGCMGAAIELFLIMGLGVLIFRRN